jgi:solute:Na+ symporter, SSS family
LFTMTRAMTVVFGLIQIAIGIWARQFGATVVSNVLTIAGFSAGLLLGVFALGVLTDKVGQAAALVGAAAALAVLIFVQFGLPHFMLTDSFPWLQPTTDPKLALKVAMPWLALIGASTTFAIGWLAAQFLPRKGIQT